jgi:hypothetical protein
MSSGALLIARLSDPERLVPTAQFLEHSEFVDCWNAVDGHVDLVAKIKTPASMLPDQIRNLPGIEELYAFDLSDESGNLVCDPAYAHSFVFLEVEHDRISSVRDRLRSLKEVAFCAPIQGTDELVIVIRGDTFTAIDRTINDQIRTTDGVLRLKQDRVISLKQI